MRIIYPDIPKPLTSEGEGSATYFGAAHSDTSIATGTVILLTKLPKP